MWSQIDQKVHDRFHELFHSSWAGAASFLVATLIGIWVWGALLAARFNHMARPLTWWRLELAQRGVHYPHWLDAIANWHAPHGDGTVLWALITVALSAIAGMHQKGAPGFGILAWLALTLSTQWFGLTDTIVRYALAVAAIAIFTIPARLMRVGRVHFSINTVSEGAINMLLDAFFPAISPIALLWGVVRTLGYDPDRHGTPPAVKLLQSQLRDLDRSATSLRDLPAATYLRASAAIQIIAASPEMQRGAVDTLSDKGPTGARLVPVLDMPQPGMVPPLINPERAGNVDGLRLYDGEPTSNI